MGGTLLKPGWAVKVMHQACGALTQNRDRRSMAAVTRRRLAGLILFMVGAVWQAGPGIATGAEPGQPVPGQGNAHLQSPGSPHPPYNSMPPTSGPHVPWLARWGVHRIPIPYEVQVHNLEDGGVIIHYRCDQPCPDTVAALERLVGAYPSQVIAVPDPRLSSKFALTAWERLATLNDFDEPFMRRFIDTYRGLDHHPPMEPLHRLIAPPPR